LNGKYTFFSRYDKKNFFLTMFFMDVGRNIFCGAALLGLDYEEEKNHRTDSAAAGGGRGLHGLRQQCEYAQALAQPLRLPVFLVKS
jgi:hypothetical protein